MLPAGPQPLRRRRPNPACHAYAAPGRPKVTRNKIAFRTEGSLRPPPTEIRRSSIIEARYQHPTMNTTLPTTLPKNCAVRPRARHAHTSTKQNAPAA